MKRWKSVLCGALTLFLVGLGSVLWWQKNNLKAIQVGLQCSTEEIEDKLQENQRVVKDAMAAVPEIVVQDVTEEERQALKDGTLSQEELTDQLVRVEQQAVPSQAEKVPEESGLSVENSSEVIQPELPQKATDVKVDYQVKLSVMIAEVYVLREQYTIALENMYAEAKSVYRTMPKEDRSKTKRLKIASDYITRAINLEKECDQKINDIITRLEMLISQHNGDMRLTEAVLNTYVQEKSLRKAWYMSELVKRGLV